MIALSLDGSEHVRACAYACVISLTTRIKIPNPLKTHPPCFNVCVCTETHTHTHSSEEKGVED